jgi:outer membrane protein OmpA-like peptidoglycan-associated protein
MTHKHRVVCSRIGFAAVLMMFVGLFWSSALAQGEPAPKIEIFTGYQWLHPDVTVADPHAGFNPPSPLHLPDSAKGAGASVTYNFTPLLGLEADGGGNWHDLYNDSTFSLGPRLTYRGDGTNIFMHTMLGLNHLAVSGLNQNNNTHLGAILGGGIDLKTGWKLLSIRLLEADYVWGMTNYANLISPGFPSFRRPSIEGARLRAGLVWNFGYPSTAIPSVTCSVQPTEVMVGEPVTANVATRDFNPKHALTYNWSSSGGKITGKDTTASIDTNGVAGGSYAVTAQVTDPKEKKNGSATCSANFTVKEPPKNPPTMSCTADPTSVQAGAKVNLTCNCTSPDNSPVTVSGWTASAGTVSGSGSNAALDTTGASPGPITVNASCSDQRGLNTSATTQVTVETPPPPKPEATKLSQCDFPNEKKPWRVDNTCKAILDDVAKNLQQNADNKLVIVGNTDPTEKRKNLAAERAVNSKAYLTGGEAKQGIDPGRIEVRTGSEGGKTAEYWTAPPGATFPEEGTTQPVDESKVKAVPDHPKPAAKKKAAKPAQ